MSIIQKIKTLFKLNSSINSIVKEAKMQTSLGKPGWKTTEFWLNVAAQIATFWGAVEGLVPPKVAAIVSISGAALYSVVRTVSKAVSDIQVTKSSPAAK